MLELPDNRVEEEDCGLGGVEAHGDIIECQSGSAVLPDLDTFLFSVYCLDLQVFGEGRVALLLGSVLEQVFGLVGDSEINHLGGRELIVDFDGEFHLFVQDARDIPNPVADSPHNLRLQLEHQGRSRQRVLLHIDEHYLALHCGAHPRYEFYLELECLLGLDPELAVAHHLEIITSFVLD